MRNAGLVLWCVLVASPALAQSTYVVGSFGMDVSRLGVVETGGLDAPGRDGEVMSGALRVGTSLGDRWGVELEFARGASLDAELSFAPRPFITTAPGGITFTSASPTPAPIGFPIALNFRQRLEQHHQTLATLAWIRQDAGDRIALVYLGGIGFWRTSRELETTFNFGQLSVLPGIPVFMPPSQTTRATTYGVDPVVGVEAHVGLTDHVRLVPGLRLQGIGDPTGSGWLLRAGVGLGWFF